MWILVLKLYFCLLWVFIATHRLPLVGMSVGYSLVAVSWLLLLQSVRSVVRGMWV